MSATAQALGEPTPGPDPGLVPDLGRVASVKDAQELVRRLTPEQRANLEETLREDPARSLWAPNPGPQALAYTSQAKELFYGGAAGGGKSALIAGLALTRHQRSLIVRRESTQLRGIVDDIARTLKTRHGLSTQAGQWRIPQPPNGPAVFADQLIEFGGVPDPGSEEKHQGIPHDLLAFDEVTQINEYVLDYLSSWNRSTDPVFAPRCRTVLTSNPPTPSTSTTARGQATGGGQWLIRRYAPWLDPQYRDPHGLGQAAPGELRYYAVLDGHEVEHADSLPFYYTPERHERGRRSDDPEHCSHGSDTQHRELIVPKSRTFIPARVHDNPYLADTDYEATLQKLPEPLRSAMLYGDFSVSLGDRPLQLIPTEWYRAATQRWLDLQGAHPKPDSRSMTALAVDVSRGGGDKTVLLARHGSYFAMPDTVPSPQTLNGASVMGKVIERRRDNAVLIIDAAGVGASVYDHARNNTSLQDYGALKGYVGSRASARRDRSGVYGFVNTRSASYWALRDALDPATPIQLAIPPHDDMQQELLTLTWTEQSGRIKVMPKDELQKHIGRSSDFSDTLVMALTVRDEESTERQAAISDRDARLEDVRGRAYAGPYNLSSRRRKASWSTLRLPYPRRI